MAAAHHHLSVVDDVNREDSSAEARHDEVEEIVTEEHCADETAKGEDHEDDAQGAAANREVPFCLEGEDCQADNDGGGQAESKQHLK